MRTLTGQTLYQCEYCGKRLLTKRGAKIHEHEYCNHHDSPHQKKIIARQSTCSHKNTTWEYSTIPGEAIEQPECKVCLGCGKRGV